MFRETVKALAKTVVTRFDIPGLAIAVVHKGDVVICDGVGVCEAGGTDAIDAHTLFRTGSLTKGFVATALMQQVRQDKLSLDSNVASLLPHLSWGSLDAEKQVTVRHLLTHNTGFPAYPSNLLAYFGFAEEAIGRLVFSFGSFNGCAGNSFQYHNGAYVAAGMVIAQLTGMPWSEYVTRHIFKPLGFADACVYGYNLSAMASGKLALPHIASGSGYRVPQFLDFGDRLGAAGGIIASAFDMANWLQFNVGSRALPDIDKSDLELIHQKHVSIPRAPGTNKLDRAINVHGYGLGWFNFQYGSLAGSYHTGSVPGYTSIAAIIPEQEFGIVVLCNKSLQKHALQALLLSACDLMLKPQEKKEPWIDIAYDIDQQLQISQDSAISADKVSTEQLTTMSGRYYHPVFGGLVIRCDGESLNLLAGPELRRFPLVCVDSKNGEFAFNMQDVREFLFYPTKLRVAVNGSDLTLFPCTDNRNGSVVAQSAVLFSGNASTHVEPEHLSIP